MSLGGGEGGICCECLTGVVTDSHYLCSFAPRGGLLRTMDSHGASEDRDIVMSGLGIGSSTYTAAYDDESDVLMLAGAGRSHHCDTAAVCEAWVVLLTPRSSPLALQPTTSTETALSSPSTPRAMRSR